MNTQCSRDLIADLNSEGKRTSCERCITIKKGCGMAEKGSERVKQRKKTGNDAKGKGKEREQEVESEEHDWLAEMGELGAEEIEAMQNAVESEQE